MWSREYWILFFTFLFRFVALLPDVEEGEVQQKLARAQKVLRERGYEISAGEASAQKEDLDLAALIRLSEQAMYRQKRTFYCGKEYDRRAENRNAEEAG